MNTNSKQSIENDEISLKYLFEKILEWYNLLLSKWKVIFLAGIIGAILGVTYSISKKNIYKATLSFALEEDKSSGGGLSGALGLAGSLGLDLGGGGGSIFTGSNLTELLKSRTMVEKTLLTPVNYNGKLISLAEMYIDINEMRDRWKGKNKLVNVEFLPNVKRDKFTRIHDSILGSIYQDLSKNALSVGQKDKKISIISIDMSSTNELFAKYFCEALAKNVSDFYIDTKSKKARINMLVLQKQTDSIRSELNGAIAGVAVANDNTFNLNPALNVRRTPSIRRQVDVQANTAILTELVKQSELAKVTLRKETPLIQIIDKPILPLPLERFGKAKGILIGGFLASFLAIIIIVVRRIVKQILDQ
ncbi:lipopolysaccharide biosynthesis protein [Flavobacterium sp. KACC 22758]|uniref:lipopolysaccharide biosynthesis protein n=1 Tax=Flavobacterium sp. KACC 22758 TaxID=3025667 RepID=UPI002366B79C|nr:lipopolysaccharide biosynthesis protein [Flavobacterium sp. KACC 22758]WDF59127.1 lipopolysaccharide biosynthesis protein [Flavobacterium sp. KACC 22758]